MVLTVGTKFRVIKSGTEYRLRTGDIWQLTKYGFDPHWHLLRGRTGYLNGISLASQMLRSGHFQRIEEVEK